MLVFSNIACPQVCCFLSPGLWAVINNAGIIGFPADGELIPMNEYKKCMAVNFFGAVHVTKTFLPLLRKSKGRLVNISSMGGKLTFYSRVMGCLSQHEAGCILWVELESQACERQSWLKIH